MVDAVPRLDQRLRNVAARIRWSRHADVGSDHGHLLAALLAAGRIEFGIAIENKRRPFDNSAKTLSGRNADVRYGDGLSVLKTGEVDGLSICGMGGESIVDILSGFPDRVPERLVLQPNRKPELIRQWALEQRFHLVDEIIVPGKRDFLVLVFQKQLLEHDPAYDTVDRQAALLFGPLLIKRFEPSFAEQLRRERRYLESFSRRSDETATRLKIIHRLIENPHRSHISC